MYIDRAHYNSGKGKEPFMPESTITAKGQTTVPAEVRRLVGAEAGARLVWHVLPTGAVLVRARTGPVLELEGLLEAPKGKHVAVDDMNPWR